MALTSSPDTLREALSLAYGQATEIAAMVAWLASEECSFSTGEVFDISGSRATY